MFSINQNHQESVSDEVVKTQKESLALIKITKSPYPETTRLAIINCLALIKITKSPYLDIAGTVELKV